MLRDSRKLRAAIALVVGSLLLTSAASVGGADTGSTELLGASGVSSNADYNDRGVAESFEAAAAASGTVSSLSVYVDSGTTATTLVAGLYADSGGQPGALIAQGSTSVSAGGWNTVSLSADVKAGTSYWISLLGTDGTLRYRDTQSGATAYASQQTTLSSLPSSWTSGKSYKTGPVSAYATGFAADNEPPTQPSGLSVSNVGQTSLTLSWTASSDNVGVSGYRVTVNGGQVATTGSASSGVTGLSCGTSYTLGVSAYDPAGNQSSQATTPASTAACAAPPPTTTSTTTSTTTATTTAGTTTSAQTTSTPTVSTPTSTTATTTATTSTAPTTTTPTTSTQTSTTSTSTSTTSTSTTSTSTTSTSTTSTSTTATAPTAPATASSSGGATLLGTTSVGSYLDYNAPGVAEAFRSTAGSSGTVSSLSVYVDPTSTGTALVAGLYADSSGQPGALLAQGSVTPKGGSWNAVPLSAQVTAGTSYWIAILGPSGTLRYRDTPNGSTAYASAQSTLTHLPPTWTSGKAYPSGPLSAYAVGALAPGTDSSPPTAPTGLSVSSVGQTSLVLSWTASSDNVGVSGYRLSVNGAALTTTTATSHVFTGLACSRTYTLGVAATDAAGNVSATASMAISTAKCPASMLLGTTAVGTVADWNPPGMAEAFKTTAAFSGTVSSLSVLVDSTSTATSLVAGLYQDNAGQPGALLAQGSIMPKAGAWNSVDLSAPVSAGASYWIAVLAPAGTLHYRDASNGAIAYASAQSTLTSLPSSWTKGAAYASGPVSAYALGIASAGSADSQPPTAPSTLTVGSVGQTAVLTSWTASTDNVGVAGYRLSVNGNQVGTTTSTSYAFTGLGCGVSYTLGVAAYDVAGNLSPTTATTVSTAPCSSVAVSLFVSPSGSDTNPCTQLAPCQSLDHAYRAATAGQIVALLGGSYPAQTLRADPSKTGPAFVTFFPASGASVQLAALDDEGASFVVFRSLAVNGTITIQNVNPGSLGAHNVALVNDSAKTLRIVGQVANISVLGGSYGNTTNSQPQIKEYNPTDPESAAPFNVLIDGVAFHDFRRSSSTTHTECLQIMDGNTITVRRSQFWNCDGTGDIGITPDSPIVNLTMENNFIGGGGDTGYGVQIGTEQRNFVFRYNSSSQSVFFSDSISGYGPYVFIGNYMPWNGWLCRGNAAYIENVLRGGVCGTTDTNVSGLDFVNSSAHNLDLAGGSEAINAGTLANFPSTDIHGDLRPMGVAPDAGADEHS